VIWPYNLGVPLADLNDVGELDLTIDGADEIDANGRMVKGGAVPTYFGKNHRLRIHEDGRLARREQSGFEAWKISVDG
jgi:hypothetical protein